MKRKVQKALCSVVPEKNGMDVVIVSIMFVGILWPWDDLYHA